MTNNRLTYGIIDGERSDGEPFAVTVKPGRCIMLAEKGPRGKKARRAAFYHRQRRERRLTRAVTILINQGAHLCVIENAHRDALVTGTGWALVGPDALVERSFHGVDDAGRIRVVDTFYDGQPGEGPCPD